MQNGSANTFLFIIGVAFRVYLLIEEKLSRVLLQ